MTNPVQIARSVTRPRHYIVFLADDHAPLDGWFAFVGYAVMDDFGTLVQVQ